MEYLTDEGFASLSQIIKPCTWAVRVTYESKRKPLETFGTAFAIKLGDPTKNDTVLMTCAHVVNKPNCCIQVRKVDDQDFTLEAKTLAIKTSWDMALLVVEGVTNPHAEFAVDGSIANCETLLHVGHAFDFVWSTFVGRAAYPCVNYIFPFNNGDTCKDYDCSSLWSTPEYRVMGHVCNKSFFEEQKSQQFSYEKNLNPHLPVIQCSGLCCNEGCSGGPVINCQGRIVGMLYGGVNDNEIALHVTLLKQFVSSNSNASPHHSLEAGSSQPPKKLKGKGFYK